MNHERPDAPPTAPDLPVWMLELSAPAQWSLLAPLWRGVQTDLHWPAPAIAVNGLNGYQLWFRLKEPQPAERGLRLLQALVRRYLPADVPAQRLRLGVTGSTDFPLAPLPPFEIPASSGTTPRPEAIETRWAAFIAADLAPIFDETPWLDLPPSEEGQAELWARLQPISPEAVQAAQLALTDSQAGLPSPAETVEARPSSAGAHPAPLADGACLDPREFLLRVMNDPSVPLALRIEAARALC